MKILVVNGGSSSFKFALFESAVFSHQQEPIWKHNIEFKNTARDRRAAIKKALKAVPVDVEIIGHRIVHGGNLFQKTVYITPHVKKSLQKISWLAPLHNPINLEGIDIAEALFPKAKQIGVFDTAFHSNMPEVSWTYPIPWKWIEAGVRRYGFHGISHQYCSERIQAKTKRKKFKLITCHLGNGSSCAAISNGQCIDTTMGFTPMEGLMMGTRSGTIDPGIIFYLQREKKMTAHEIDQCLNKESGLLAIGGSFDLRDILAKMNKKDERAELAFNLYVHRLKQAIGSLTATLDGLDYLCFTAGIGENSPEIRQQTINGLQYLGIKLNKKLNENCSKDTLISTPDSKVKVFVIHAREDWQIAKECFSLRES